MKKIFIRLSSLALAIIFVFIMAACSTGSNKELEDIPSGQKLELNDTTLKITHKFDVKKAKDGYVPGADVKIDISGYPEQVSYFEGAVEFTWSYEYLSDSGEYTPNTYTITVNLSPEGKGSFKGTVDFPNARNIRNVEVSFTATGYGVRK